MDNIMEQQFELCGKAFDIEASGNLPKAIECYREALLLNPSNPAPYLYLGFGLARDGKLDAANQIYSLAADLSPQTINAWRNPQISADLRERSRHADDAIRSHFTSMHQQAVTEYGKQNPGAKIDRIYAAIWCATHDAEFSYKQTDQLPHLFYVPDLEPIAVFNREDYEWCATLEASFASIRDEFLTLWNDPDVTGAPYIDAGSSQLEQSWQPLIGSNNWESFHLYKGTESFTENISRVPITHQALQVAPLLRTNGTPREVVFSVLKGQQHIPPHYGLANTDMTVHLPLLNLEDCAIKVREETYPWEEGKLFLFDDSFIHESWNKGSKDRVTLLFSTWHPDLTEDERNAITLSFSHRDAWNAARAI